MSPYRIRVVARDGRDLTPLGSEDRLGFEEAVAVLLSGQQVRVGAALMTGPDRGGPEPGLAVTVQVVTSPDPDEPEANDTGAVVAWEGRGAAGEPEAQAMLLAMETAVALASAADSHIRTGWFLAREPREVRLP